MTSVLCPEPAAVDKGGEQVMLDPSGKSKVPTDKQVRVSETFVAVAGAGPISTVADPVRVTTMILPSCVSNGAPGGEKTPAASATPPPTKTEPAHTPIPRRHRQRRRRRGVRSTFAIRASRSAEAKTGSISRVVIGASPSSRRLALRPARLPVPRPFELGHDESRVRAAPSEMPRAVAAWAGE